ncbi:MAG: hypothetical protein AB7E96_12610 [Deferribacterales bacterium]
MKKTITAVLMAVSLAGCGAAAVQQTEVPSEGKLRTYEIQQTSNTKRIEKLEKELSEAKTSLEQIQRQSKQLGESYDSLLALFNEQKKMMVNLIQILSGGSEKQENKGTQQK